MAAMWSSLRRFFQPTPPRAIDDVAWARACAALRLVDAYGDAERAVLRARTAEFLARRALTGVQGMELDEHRQLVIAIQCCLPLLHLSLDALGHWHEVVVYPGTFRVRRHDRDEETDVVTEWDDELAGEAWSQGPIVLSWADIEQDLEAPFEGFNVIIHEIAHKIDMADGAADGMPPLRDRQQRDDWRTVMQRCFDALVAEVERGDETVIDAYAAEAPDEFFAVVSEYYFTAPDVLAEHYPDVHAAFARFYGPVPMPSPAA